MKVDERAASLGVSRNRLIVRALERELSAKESWSPGFLDALRGAARPSARFSGTSSAGPTQAKPGALRRSVSSPQAKAPKKSGKQAKVRRRS